MEKVAKILEKKSSINQEELVSLVGFLPLAAKVVCPRQVFF